MQSNQKFFKLAKSMRRELKKYIRKELKKYRNLVDKDKDQYEDHHNILTLYCDDRYDTSKTADKATIEKTISEAFNRGSIKNPQSKLQLLKLYLEALLKLNDPIYINSACNIYFSFYQFEQFNDSEIDQCVIEKLCELRNQPEAIKWLERIYQLPLENIDEEINRNVIHIALKMDKENLLMNALSISKQEEHYEYALEYTIKENKKTRAERIYNDAGKNKRLSDKAHRKYLDFKEQLPKKLYTEYLKECIANRQEFKTIDLDFQQKEYLYYQVLQAIIDAPQQVLQAIIDEPQYESKSRWTDQVIDHMIEIAVQLRPDAESVIYDTAIRAAINYNNSEAAINCNKSDYAMYLIAESFHKKLEHNNDLNFWIILMQAFGFHNDYEAILEIYKFALQIMTEHATENSLEIIIQAHHTAIKELGKSKELTNIIYVIYQNLHEYQQANLQIYISMLIAVCEHDASMTLTIFKDAQSYLSTSDFLLLHINLFDELDAVNANSKMRENIKTAYKQTAIDLKNSNQPVYTKQIQKDDAKIKLSQSILAAFTLEETPQNSVEEENDKSESDLELTTEYRFQPQPLVTDIPPIEELTAPIEPFTIPSKTRIELKNSSQPITQQCNGEEKSVWLGGYDYRITSPAGIVTTGLIKWEDLINHCSFTPPSEASLNKKELLAAIQKLPHIQVDLKNLAKGQHLVVEQVFKPKPKIEDLSIMTDTWKIPPCTEIELRVSSKTIEESRAGESKTMTVDGYDYRITNAMGIACKGFIKWQDLMNHSVPPTTMAPPSTNEEILLNKDRLLTVIESLPEIQEDLKIIAKYNRRNPNKMFKSKEEKSFVRTSSSTSASHQPISMSRKSSGPT